jgi:tripartite-type tricarboxylate transporter receptor subunit TctC
MLLRCLLFTLLAALASPVAAQDAYPSKPVRFIVPFAVVQFLQAELEKVYADAAVRERLAGIGVDPVWIPGPQLAKAIETDGERWARVIKSANIRAE